MINMENGQTNRILANIVSGDDSTEEQFEISAFSLLKQSKKFLVGTT
jgi:hypothetical protein